jgi:5'-nucleotidase
MRLSRREFLWNGLRAGATALLGARIRSAPLDGEETRITLLHTNDVHSRLEPFPPDDPRYAGLGGAARRAALVKRLRRENPNTLLVDAGDAFQGTPYYNVYRGEADYQVMSAIGYDVVTLGNHEFDSGLEALARALSVAKFDVVCANYDFRETLLRDRIKPYVVRDLAGVRIGIFGLGIALDGLVPERHRAGVRFYDPVATARAMVRTLREREEALLVVCLSHLGLYDDSERRRMNPPPIGDREIARAVEGIDVIIGGHTHTFMKEPELVRRPSGGATLIFQVGFGGIVLGRLDLFIRAQQLVGFAGHAVPISERALA